MLGGEQEPVVGVACGATREAGEGQGAGWPRKLRAPSRALLGWDWDRDLGCTPGILHFGAAVIANKPFLFILFKGSYTSDGKEYIFYLNVCGEAKSVACNNKKEAAVCQVKKSDNTQVKIAGRPQNQTLR